MLILRARSLLISPLLALCLSCSSKGHDTVTNPSTGDGDHGDGDKAPPGDGDGHGDGDAPGDGDKPGHGDGDKPGDGDAAGDGDGTPDHDAGVKRPPPGPGDPADGPGQKAHLEGVWNQPFEFDMSKYPLSWAIATVHASMLYRAAGINYSPNAVISIAIKESALSCANPNPQNAQEQMAVMDGCFQIEDLSAYTELKADFPERFTAPHADTVSAGHFESAALTTFYYGLFSLARFRDYRAETGDPQAFFDQHPDPQAAQKVLCGAYNRGLWWTQLTSIFRDCRKAEVTTCFGGHEIAIDHATKIADYTRTLDGVTPFDKQLTLADLNEYWTRISALYPDADASNVKATLKESFDALRGDQPTLSFHQRIRQVLAALIAVLPAAPTQDEAAARLCKQSKLMPANCP
jgi:hypothetical protein